MTSVSTPAPITADDATWRIERIHARIVDIPTIRPHKFSFGAINRQSPVIVQLWLANGACGFGEAATIGGPSWNEESPETILHAIQNYLAPAVAGADARRFAEHLNRFDAVCKGNTFAKSAVEMALLDAVARSLGVPAWQLLGGKRIERLPLAWTLASGDSQRDLEEAEQMMQARRHRLFKLKIGARSPADDVAHVTRIARGLDGRADMTVDVNQAWDGNTARRYLPQLVEAGVTLIEQPVAKWDVQALREATQSLGSAALIMADETVCSAQDAYMLAAQRACHVFSLKVAKHGGLLRTREVAAVAQAAGIGWYGGTMLETSLGSAASAHVFATLSDQHHGCELFGPQLLVDDIVEQPMTVRDFELHLPDGPGFGVVVDEKRLERFDRARAGLTPATVDFGRRGEAAAT
ncbi:MULTISPECIES: muconate cycloisomerase family protein [Achromobacter]|uniref:Muconate cycloisomerase 1 n=1 Tax=Achromobacter aegrifaciens TaxID=1287736 RepID=A0AAD2IVZ4_ACHAE|nr:MULTISPECIES: muconate cycloisomerase family protein [Achromobacter]MBD9384198.1 muconate cycloisomerase family protein [Achromobacter sp. ACM02]MBD9421686.1 muconate cycloisomerase family protein [Achromobacter sp. ACM04]MBD9432975.1 muconate cycloisomerase family protein [Achromobacter sp. ACM03]MDQ1763024.1 muconate cycloisomerase family protein [Achromobacter aegrifaciens]MDR7944320.1 muconate cycloisomerase family protein [Achromobacter aegrifaciens]